MTQRVRQLCHKCRFVRFAVCHITGTKWGIIKITMTNIECELCEIDGKIELSEDVIPELDV